MSPNDAWLAGQMFERTSPWQRSYTQVLTESPEPSWLQIIKCIRADDKGAFHDHINMQIEWPRRGMRDKLSGQRSDFHLKLAFRQNCACRGRRCTVTSFHHTGAIMTSWNITAGKLGRSPRPGPWAGTIANRTKAPVERGPKYQNLAPNRGKVNTFRWKEHECHLTITNRPL